VAEQSKPNAPKRPPSADSAALAAATAAADRRAASQSSGLPIIGRWPAKKQRQAVSVITGLALFVAMGCGWQAASTSQTAAQGAKTAAQSSALAQRLAKSAGLASQARKGSFDELRHARDGLDARVSALADGGAVDGQAIKATDAQSAAGVALAATQTAWKDARTNADVLIQAQGPLAEFQNALNTMNALDARLQTAAQALRQDGANGAGRRATDAADQLVALTQRMGKNVNALTVSDQADPAPAFALGKDLPAAQSLVADLSQQANSATGAWQQDATEAMNAFVSYGRAATVAQNNSSFYLNAKNAWRGLADSSESVSEASDRLVAAFEGQQSRAQFFWWTAAVFTILFFLGLAGLAKLFAAESDAIKQAALRARESDSHNSAVMNLMAEISPLGDGDLTVKASTDASFGFTNMLANAINYPIGELRALILAVRQTAQNVTASTDAANQIAGEMLHSAQGQYSRLADAGARIDGVGDSMGQIAEEAQEAVRVARQSEEAAKSGAQVVNDSIKKMDAIRQTIQDTSKKIKLLGESSTAIGEAASLIRDITKQISILSLNAAIQAAAAGEAGFGFAAVAEEVQRLALSSAEAAGRIDDLVNNIQTDAKGAVAAMEESTRQVVEGARGADQTGEALREIGVVATRVAQSVGKMAVGVQAEAEEADALSREMQGLREAAEAAMRDAESARAAVEAVKRISDELGESVSGFKV